MSDLIIPPPMPLPTQLAEKVRDYARAARAPATLKAYRGAYQLFMAWCEQQAREPLPASAETLGHFLADSAARYKPSTLNKLVSGIAFAHRAAGHPFDRKAFEMVMAGIRRTHGTAPRRMVTLTTGDLRHIVGALPDTTQGLRDRALLLIGFAGAFRRSELVGLDIGEPAPGGTGLVEIGEEGRGSRCGALRPTRKARASSKASHPTASFAP
jgi:site-specific recombinase XerD